MAFPLSGPWHYGNFPSVQRGRRRRQGREPLPLGPVPFSEETATARIVRASWARLIKKVFAADPLVCPDCGGAMQIIASILLVHVPIGPRQIGSRLRSAPP